MLACKHAVITSFFSFETFASDFLLGNNFLNFSHSGLTTEEPLAMSESLFSQVLLDWITIVSDDWIIPSTSLTVSSTISSLYCFGIRMQESKSTWKHYPFTLVRSAILKWNHSQRNRARQYLFPRTAAAKQVQLATRPSWRDTAPESGNHQLDSAHSVYVLLYRAQTSRISHCKESFVCFLSESAFLTGFWQHDEQEAAEVHVGAVMDFVEIKPILDY